MVINGGPESLKWTAATYNGRTGERLSEFVKFQHRSKKMNIPIDKSKVCLGDNIFLKFDNDNFPDDQGFLQIYGTMSA